ncbi:unnamed protein product [Linum tenue]|uniref:Glutaredoxin domain-containing protein n=1 Tax=Linum tenue TaxID=586396 RepID=A0AAV0GY90_9ROSI|nr:unnamed protein product [Linum tenue]
MWPDWLKSPTRVPSPTSNSTSISVPAHKKKFSCSSFKDIQTLISEPDHGGGGIGIGSSAPPSISPRTPSIFHRVRISTSVLRYLRKSLPPSLPQLKEAQQQQDCVVLYFTSLRVVRRTFEDCYAVRSILRGFRVPIDERDLSMDGKYLGEVQEILGTSGKVTLPVVLIGGRRIVGLDEIRELHESGELKRIFSGLSAAAIAPSNECDLCGGLRFVLCEQCSGSHKIYSEKHGFRSCAACNVNGLVRCPDCYPPARRRMSIA